jgi:hypothetical protein
MPHPPTHPQLYRATPIGPDGVEQEGQDYLITPFCEGVWAAKITALLVGAALGFLLGALATGFCKR